MRRLAITGVLVLGLVAAPATAQEEMPEPTYLCITVLGEAPVNGWTVSSFVAAILTGTAQVTTVMAPELCEAPAAETYDLDGILVLRDRDARWKKGGACRGKRGYDDIRPGMQIRVRDSDGTLLGIGSLEDGKAYSARECWFWFTIEHLPRARLYELESGRRGILAYSFEEIDERGWLVEITIG